MSEIEKLKPCPFCGGEAEVRKFTETKFFVQCFFVQCKSCLIGTTFKSEHEAVKVWNRRYTVFSKLKKVVREWLKNWLKD